MTTMLEFTTKVKQGQIEIPQEYQQQLQDGDTVKVTAATNSFSTTTGAIAQLINNPIPVKKFIPLTREETHERG